MKATTKDKSQVDKFKEAARELETDDSGTRFDAVLEKIAKAPPTKAIPPRGES